MTARVAAFEDLALVQRCLAGDDHAWRKVFHDMKPICRCIVAKYGVVMDFDELYAEFMLKLVGSSSHRSVLCQYKGRASLKTYLAVVFARVALGYMRAQRRAVPCVSLDNLPRSVEPCCTPYDNTEELLHLSIKDALRQLSASDRLIVEAYFFHGESQSAIAAILGVDASTISRRLKAALVKLKPAALHLMSTL